MPNLAPQMRTAFSSIASNTGTSSPGELDMTFSTSEVAVCCSSDSVKSSVRWRNSLKQPRVFDRDNGLRGEIGNKLDLLVGERSNFLTIDNNDADQTVDL